MHHVLGPTSPVSSPRTAPIQGLGSSPILASEVWGLAKDMTWPCSRGSVTSLLPDLVGMNLELGSCVATTGHLAMCFRYSDTVSNYSIVVVLDAIPEKKYDQSFQLELIKELCKPSSSELRSKEETFRSSNADMLICRHESPVVKVCFIRDRSTSPQNANLLRCVVVREDASAHTWEWSHDKFAWTYLNQFVLAPESRISQVECSSAFSMHQHVISWVNHERNLYCRPLGFELVQSLAKHPTRIVLGSAQTLMDSVSCSTYSSKKGLWIVTDEDIQLRSATTPKTWKIQLPSEADVLKCVHTTTGGLILLDPISGKVWTVLEQHGALGIRSNTSLLDLPNEPVHSIASHRQFIFLLCADHCHVYDLHNGHFIHSLLVSDPNAAFWSTSDAVGIWSWNGVWRIKLPSAKQYSEHLANAVSDGPELALRHLKDYGEVLQFEQAAAALECLRSKSTNRVLQPEWKFFRSLSESPAWLLSLLDDHSIPLELIDDLRSLLHDMETFHSSIVKEKGPARGSVRTTPLNLESYDHIRAWLQGRHVRAGIIQDISYLTKTTSLPPKTTIQPSFAKSRMILQETSLHLASWVSSLRYGTLLLSQLEQLLLENVDFKNSVGNVRSRDAIPSHVLFHDERVTAQESIRHPSYFEWLARLYFQHEPSSYEAFVTCISSFCPRVFTLDGLVRLVRPHADRALLLLPPMRLNLFHAPSNMDATVLAYTRALVASQMYVEALQWLLQFRMLEQAKELYLTVPTAVQPTSFWLLLEYVAQNAVEQLGAYVSLKPSYLPPTHVLAALRQALPPSVSVQVVRPVLQSILKMK